MRPTREWTNFGDVNFAECGGCQVRPAYSQDELKEHPILSTMYEVFSLYPVDDDTVQAYLSRVDLDDYPEKAEDIASMYGYSPDSPLEKAYLLADYIGPQESIDTAYRQAGMYSKRKDFFITREDAAAWMKELGIA